MFLFRPGKNPLVAETLNNIAEFFPYFLTLYAAALLMDMFLGNLGNYFSWAAFHSAVVALGIASFFSPTFQAFLAKPHSSRLPNKLLRGYWATINLRELIKITLLITGFIAGIAWFTSPLPVFVWSIGLFAALYGMNNKLPIAAAAVVFSISLVPSSMVPPIFAESAPLLVYYLLIITLISEVRAPRMLRQHKGTS